MILQLGSDRINVLIGSIPGELSFAANSGEFARTRANSGELRANSPTVRQHRHPAELRRTFAGVRRTFGGVRRSSPRFDRVRPYSAANWRTVRQKIRSLEEIHPPLTSVRRERVRRELRSRDYNRRTKSAADPPESANQSARASAEADSGGLRRTPKKSAESA